MIQRIEDKFNFYIWFFFFAVNQIFDEVFIDIYTHIIYFVRLLHAALCR